MVHTWICWLQAKQGCSGGSIASSHSMDPRDRAEQTKFKVVEIERTVHNWTLEDFATLQPENVPSMCVTEFVVGCQEELLAHG